MRIVRNTIKGIAIHYKFNQNEYTWPIKHGLTQSFAEEGGWTIASFFLFMKDIIQDGERCSIL